MVVVESGAWGIGNSEVVWEVDAASAVAFHGGYVVMAVEAVDVAVGKTSTDRANLSGPDK